MIFTRHMRVFEPLVLTTDHDSSRCPFPPSHLLLAFRLSQVAVFGGSYDTAHDVFGLLLLYDPEANEWHLPESGPGPGQVTGAPPMPR